VEFKISFKGVQELAAYTQLTEEELSDILLLIQKADQKDK